MARELIPFSVPLDLGDLLLIWSATHNLSFQRARITQLYYYSYAELAEPGIEPGTYLAVRTRMGYQLRYIVSSVSRFTKLGYKLRKACINLEFSRNNQVFCLILKILRFMSLILTYHVNNRRNQNHEQAFEATECRIINNKE